MLIMKQLEKSTEHMRASSFMSLTVFDAMSIKVLDENYLWNKEHLRVTIVLIDKDVIVKTLLNF